MSRHDLTIDNQYEVSVTEPCGTGQPSHLLGTLRHP